MGRKQLQQLALRHGEPSASAVRVKPPTDASATLPDADTHTAAAEGSPGATQLELPV